VSESVYLHLINANAYNKLYEYSIKNGFPFILVLRIELWTDQGVLSFMDHI